MSFIARKLTPGLCAAAVASTFLLGAGSAAEARAPLFDEARGILTVAPLLAQATPAVVNISVSATRPGQQQNPLAQDPFFRRFFGGGEEGSPASQQRVMAAGSGVIIDAAKGFVVTNNHVVENADTITVTLKDGRQLTGKLLGRDADTDLAVVQVSASNLTGLRLADSDALQVGDVVFAIGNPFGLGQTVTSGIVSALGRTGLNAEHYENFIQTDAPINPGNSGGALIDSKGELAGINTAIIAPGGGNVGIGFAVPANMVKAVVDQLERYGEVKRGRIGVSIQTVTPSIASAMGLGEVRGVAINSVEKGSAADRAGLKTGDVIVEVDGRPVQVAAQVRNGVGLKEVGSKVKLTYLREGQRKTAEIAIEQRPQTEASASGQQEGGLPRLAGASFSSETGGKVVVTDVRQSSPAWSLGLRPGDVIVSFNRQPVHSVNDLRSAAGKVNGGTMALDVRRGESELLIFAG